MRHSSIKSTKKDRLPNLKDTITRHKKPGNLAILILAIWLVIPYVIDKYRGEPYIHSSLFFLVQPTTTYILEEINVKHPNRGIKSVIVYDKENRIMCAKNFVSYWDKSYVRTWSIEAFTGCPEPQEDYKICNIFSLTGISGVERVYGTEENYCTSMRGTLNEQQTH